MKVRIDIVTILVISLCFLPQILSTHEEQLTSHELVDVDSQDENECLDSG